MAKHLPTMAPLTAIAAIVGKLAIPLPAAITPMGLAAA